MSNYKVKIGADGLPSVVDDSGQAVDGGKVHRVEFPNTSLDTPEGPVWVIDGPGKAVITVPGRDGGLDVFTNVPLG